MSGSKEDKPAFPAPTMDQNLARGSFWNKQVKGIEASPLEVKKWKKRAFYSPLLVLPGAQGSVDTDLRSEISLRALSENVLGERNTVEDGDELDIAMMGFHEEEPEVLEGTVKATEAPSEEVEEVAALYEEFPVDHWYENGVLMVSNIPDDMSRGRYNTVLTDPQLDLGNLGYETAVVGRNDAVYDIFNILNEGVVEREGSDSDYRDALQYLEMDPEDLVSE